MLPSPNAPYARAARQYQTLGNESGIHSASPHQLISMLLLGAIDRIAAAKGHMERKDMNSKGIMLGKALSIVGELRASLNREQGGEIASNLDSLYDYLERLLIQANVQNKAALLDEASKLLGEVRDAWQAIAPAPGA
jgi:flagellar protein FliS